MPDETMSGSGQARHSAHDDRSGNSGNAVRRGARGSRPASAFAPLSASPPPPTQSASSTSSPTPVSSPAQAVRPGSSSSASASARHGGKPTPGALTSPLQDGKDPLTFHSDGLPLLTADGLPLARSSTAVALHEEVARRRIRRWLWAALLVMLALLITEFLYLAPFTDPAVGLPARTPVPIPLAEVNPYGVNTFLHKEVDRWKKEKTFEMAASMGVGWIKQQFPWAEIEYRVDPNRPFWDVKNNQNAWDKFDQIVDMAQQYGVRIIARIDSTPPWARPTDPATLKALQDQGLDPAKAPPSPEHMEDFGRFIRTFVERYRGRVAAIQVWNEPNLKREWATGRPVNAGEYVEMLRVAYTAAKEADPNIIVLAAPLATTNETKDNLRETDYLQQMYDAGAKLYFDVMAANAYGKDYPPEDPPSPGKLNFRRVELLRQVMEKNGDAGKPIWFNEYGWNASPASMPPEKLLWGRVTPDQQAEYTVRGIEYARQHWPWAGVFTIWYLRQVGDIPPDQSEYYFALVSPDFVVSSAYSAVQAMARRDEQIATKGEWGPLASPVHADPRWQIRLNPAVPGGVYLQPSTIGSTLTIPFEGTDLKLMLVPPTATEPVSTTQSTQDVQARYYVSVDGASRAIAPDLPRDENGRAYIPVPQGGQITQVTLVRGLDSQIRTGRHTLQISVEALDGSGDRQSAGGRIFAPTPRLTGLPGIGTVTVEVNRSYALFILMTLALPVGILMVLWALRLTGGQLRTQAPPDSPDRH